MFLLTYKRQVELFVCSVLQALLANVLRERLLWSLLEPFSGCIAPFEGWAKSGDRRLCTPPPLPPKCVVYGFWHSIIVQAGTALELLTHV